MATECYSQLGFGFQPKRVVAFAGGTLTTDAGLLLVREFDQQLGLSSDVVGRITDTRDARYVTHARDAFVRLPRCPCLSRGDGTPRHRCCRDLSAANVVLYHQETRRRLAAPSSLHSDAPWR
jgi:DDE family transposase